MATKFAIETIFKAVDMLSAPLRRMTAGIKKLDSAARLLRTPFDAITRGAKRLALVGVGAATASVGALAIALNKASDEADVLAKLARRLDFDIEALQQWHFIAEQSGVSVELLNKSLGAFSKRLGEAKTGQGPLVSGLKKLNPQLLKQLKRTESISDAFLLYINAIRDADSATTKAALANAAFSRSGLSLVQISHNSADAINDMMSEMRANGLITQEAAEGAEAYNDAMNSLKRAIRGTIHVAVLPLARILTPIIRDFREWAITNKEIIKQRLVYYVERTIAVVKRLITAAEGSTLLHDVLETAARLARKVGSAVEYLERNWERAGDVLKWVAGVYVALQTVLIVTNTWVAVAAATTGTITAATWLWSFAAGGVTKALVTLRAAVLALNLVMYANPIGLVIAAIAALSAVVAAAVIYWDDITAAVGRAWEMFAEAGIWADIAVGALALLTGPIGWLAGSAALITKHWEPISGFFTDLWAGVVMAFEAAIAKIKAAVAVVVGAVKKVIAAGRAVTDFVGLTDEAPEEQTPVGGGAATGINRRVQVAGPMSEVLRRMAEEPGMAEIVLRNETNATAEVSSHSGSIGLKIANSGGFQ